MTKISNISILFLGKKNDDYCSKALKFTQDNFENVSSHLGDWGERLPDEIERWDGDYIISYLSRWIVPEQIINKSKIAAINFHPATPDYPGIGCNNFALYKEAKIYGVTCHHMEKQVDTGEIIAVKRFPVFQSDDVSSILSRTYQFQLCLFYEILGGILSGEKLPSSSEKWLRKPFSRREFNELGKIKPDMSTEEIKRRVRATSFGIWQPTVEIGGFTFELKTTKKVE